MVDGLVLEDLDVFKYLVSLVTPVWRVEEDVQHIVLKGSKVLGAVKSVLKGKTMSWWGVKNVFEMI